MLIWDHQRDHSINVSTVDAAVPQTFREVLQEPDVRSLFCDIWAAVVSEDYSTLKSVTWQLEKIHFFENITLNHCTIRPACILLFKKAYLPPWITFPKTDIHFFHITQLFRLPDVSYHILVFIGPASIACGEINGCSSDDSLPTSQPYITPAVTPGNPALPD